MKSLHYNLVFKPEPEGGFTVIAPILPGCVTYGKNLKEAKEMAKDAILGYIASLKKHGEKIPSDSNNFIFSLDVEVEDKLNAKNLVYV